MRSRKAAYAKHAKYDPRQSTAKAREASPGSLTRWEREVDPDGSLSASERRRKAEAALSAHMTGLSLLSSVARSKGA